MSTFNGIVSEFPDIRSKPSLIMPRVSSMWLHLTRENQLISSGGILMRNRLLRAS
jgi:hypothetical protein